MALLLVRPLRGSVTERQTSRWFVPLGGPSLRDGLRSFDKASAHCLGNGFDARLDAKLLVDMTKMRLDCGRGNRTTHTGHLHELSTALRRICRAGCGKAAPALQQGRGRPCHILFGLRPYRPLRGLLRSTDMRNAPREMGILCQTSARANGGIFAFLIGDLHAPVRRRGGAK